MRQKKTEPIKSTGYLVEEFEKITRGLEKKLERAYKALEGTQTRAFRISEIIEQLEECYKNTEDISPIHAYIARDTIDQLSYFNDYLLKVCYEAETLYSEYKIAKKNMEYIYTMHMDEQ